MFRTQTNIIRGLTKEEYHVLKEMCKYSNNLYNVALYQIRQYYFENNHFLNYEGNCSVCKENANYKMLQAGVAQQIIKSVDRNFKSYFNLIKKYKTDEYRYHKISIPKYRTKGELFDLILSTNAIVIRNGYLRIPMSFAFRREHPGLQDIYIRFPSRINANHIKEVRILPKGGGKWFEVQYVYEVSEEPKNLNRDNVLSIDLGIDNLATCVSTVGTPFIMDGRKLKSINHQWNKEIARLRSISMKQGLKTTNRIQRITAKRNNQVNDCIKKTARYIINYCIENDIGSLVVGYNADFKRNSNIGRRNNQNLNQIPFGYIRYTISNMCKIYDIDYIEQEESYTSKASCLDGDTIPVYSPSDHKQYNFSGTRIFRGLYQTKEGIKINADVNASANILRKCKQNIPTNELCNGLLVSPRRIRLI